MKSTIIISALSIAIFSNSCSSSNKESSESYSQNDSSSVSSSNASSYENILSTLNDSTRKFIRTVELKFKVKNVEKATYSIESCVNKHGGYIVNSNLNSTINDLCSSSISADSLVETTNYTMTNSITLRVSNQALDTTLSEIAKCIDFLDYRIIKADDVALKILGNKLIQKRNSTSQVRLSNAIEQHGKKLNETVEAEDKLLSAETEKDNATLANLNLQDMVNYSTVTLSIYQHQASKSENIKTTIPPLPYEPTIGQKLTNAFDGGMHVFEYMLVFIVRLWSIILLSIIGFILYKRFKNKSQLSESHQE